MYSSSAQKGVSSLDKDDAFAMIAGLTGRGLDVATVHRACEIFDRGEAAGELTEITRMAVLDLPEVHRNILMLRYWDNVSKEHLALVLGLSLGRIQELLTEARHLLRQRICAKLGEMAAA